MAVPLFCQYVLARYPHQRTERTTELLTLEQMRHNTAAAASAPSIRSPERTGLGQASATTNGSSYHHQRALGVSRDDAAARERNEGTNGGGDHCHTFTTD